MVKHLQRRAIGGTRIITAECTTKHQIRLLGRMLRDTEDVSHLVRDETSNIQRSRRRRHTHRQHELRAAEGPVRVWERFQILAVIRQTKRGYGESATRETVA